MRSDGYDGLLFLTLLAPNHKRRAPSLDFLLYTCWTHSRFNVNCGQPEGIFRKDPNICVALLGEKKYASTHKEESYCP